MPSAEPTFRTYRVQSGDTLSAIAARFNTTVGALVNLNDLNEREPAPRRPGAADPELTLSAGSLDTRSSPRCAS